MTSEATIEKRLRAKATNMGYQLRKVRHYGWPGCDPVYQVTGLQTGGLLTVWPGLDNLAEVEVWLAENA